MTNQLADGERNAEVVPLRAAPYVTVTPDQCIGCGDPELVDSDLCADCQPLHPQPAMGGAK